MELWYLFSLSSLSRSCGRPSTQLAFLGRHPVFYLYQMLWFVISPVLTAIVLFRDRGMSGVAAKKPRTLGEKAEEGPCRITVRLSSRLPGAVRFITGSACVAHWRKGDLRPAARNVGPGLTTLGTHQSPWFLVCGVPLQNRLHVRRRSGGSASVRRHLPFFAVPYTIIIYPFLFLVFPRLWHVATSTYITAGQLRARRFGNAGSRWR